MATTALQERQAAAEMISAKSEAFSEAPPTRAPLTSGTSKIDAALEDFTDPP
jgi:hypothetical protein